MSDITTITEAGCLCPAYMDLLRLQREIRKQELIEAIIRTGLVLSGLLTLGGLFYAFA